MIRAFVRSSPLVVGVPGVSFLDRGIWKEITKGYPLRLSSSQQYYGAIILTASSASDPNEALFSQKSKNFKVKIFSLCMIIIREKTSNGLRWRQVEVFQVFKLIALPNATHHNIPLSYLHICSTTNAFLYFVFDPHFWTRFSSISQQNMKKEEFKVSC